MSHTQPEPPLSMSPEDQQALLMIVQGLIYPKTGFSPKGRAIVLQTLVDASRGDEDAVFALLALGRVGLVLFGKAHNPAITSDYADMLLQLMGARRYAEIVLPDALNRLTNIAEARRAILDPDATNP